MVMDYDADYISLMIMVLMLLRHQEVLDTLIEYHHITGIYDHFVGGSFWETNGNISRWHGIYAMHINDYLGGEPPLGSL